MPINQAPGTLQSPKIGTFGATKVYSGSIAKARFYQAMGTHLNGSVGGLGAVTRYAVWPVAFANGSYQGVITPLVRTATDLNNLSNGITSRKAGSMQYVVVNSSAVSNAPYGSLFIIGLVP